MDNIRTILMIEDDENHIVINKRKIIRSNLKYKDWAECGSIREAKEIVEKSPVDIIFLDLNLEDCKGAESVTKVREFYQGLLIVLTSMDQESIGVECIRNGADEFMVKNEFTEKQVYEKVLFGIEKRRRLERLMAVDQKLELAQKIGESIG